MPPTSSTGAAARKGIFSARGLKPVAPRKSGGISNNQAGPSGSSRTGPAAKGGDEGYLYLAGVKDGSKRVGEFSVCSLFPSPSFSS
jgi:hypothetical protein